MEVSTANVVIQVILIMVNKVLLYLYNVQPNAQIINFLIYVQIIARKLQTLKILLIQVVGNNVFVHLLPNIETLITTPVLLNVHNIYHLIPIAKIVQIIVLNLRMLLFLTAQGIDVFVVTHFIHILALMVKVAFHNAMVIQVLVQITVSQTAPQAFKVLLIQFFKVINANVDLLRHTQIQISLNVLLLVVLINKQIMEFVYVQDRMYIRAQMDNPAQVTVLTTQIQTQAQKNVLVIAQFFKILQIQLKLIHSVFALLINNIQKVIFLSVNHNVISNSFYILILNNFIVYKIVHRVFLDQSIQVSIIKDANALLKLLQQVLI
ncbi:transmembrane protein, putative (macronuclear) [Tetrahymena thermophila SB210]|uniref:Transmembrane protein, putative n=1 Tax=Tetrahymena thermophila (strain SB210) TaxID=312017 RepID=W7XD76_TETTS|nr:transmembrane protein, putative [Tetrahymena thermophila SB210]EWS71776.1 transmembrane protein, putative [Tetrahymena thermophila SB210]|eukprot:XP_012655663.1 transmembrane protein, putative [Tetrahymena thermophila SB210]